MVKVSFAIFEPWMWFASCIQWRSWVKTWAGALSRFLDIYIGVNWEYISMTAISHFLKLILILLWNTWNKTYVFIMKFKVWSLLPEGVAQFLTPLYQLFTKIIMSLDKIWAIFKMLFWRNLASKQASKYLST